MICFDISMHYLMHESNTISVIEIAVTMGMEALGIARDTTLPHSLSRCHFAKKYKKVRR